MSTQSRSFQILVKTPGKAPELMSLPGDESEVLSFLQGIVKDCIEAVPLFPEENIYIICGEHARLKTPTPKPNISLGKGPLASILGPIAIVRVDAHGNTVGLKASQITGVRNFLLHTHISHAMEN